MSTEATGGYGQQGEMEHVSMVATLETQARMVWPQERPLLVSWGIERARRLADLGCGTGEFALRAAETWPALAVTGVELFEGHLAHGHRRKAERGLDNLELRQGDARALDLDDASFDWVSLRHFTHAIPDADRVLAEARRILTPGGRVYVLAEDYAALFFDPMSLRSERLFIDAQPQAMATGTDLFHGRRAARMLRTAGFRDVQVRPLWIDTENTPGALFAEMLGHWRDGYAQFLATAHDTTVEDIVERFQDLIDSAQDPLRHASWVLFAITATT